MFNKVNLAIIAMLLSFKSYSADFKNGFVRINSVEAALETLFKAYSRDGVSIKLIPMYHVAEKSFYDRVEKEFPDKTVIYEQFGGDLESKKRSLELVAIGENLSTKLGSSYLKAFQTAQNLITPFYATSHRYGLSTQSVLKYEFARELIFADTMDQKLNSHLKEMSEFFADEEKFRYQNFILPAKKLVKQGKIADSEEEEELVRKLSVFLDDSLRKQIAKYPERVEMLIRQWFEEDKLMLSSQDKFYQQMVVNRNKIVFEKIQELLKRSNGPDEIVICYGAGHIPMIEDFLLSIGFLSKESGDEWIKVISLH